MTRNQKRGRGIMGLFFLMIQTVSLAQVTDSLSTSRVFELGTVTIEALQSTKTLDQPKNLALNHTDVSQSLCTLPGVTLTHIGSRNEYSINVRGFDARSVPLFIDGVPVYVAYDGNVDLGRFKTFDYSALSVSKGLTPMAYGANTIGGSINLVSWKPDAKLNVQAIAGYASGNSWEYGVNIGTRQEKFYLLASLYNLQADDFPLSSDFKARTQEDGGRRENSYFKDQKINLKAGWTPNSGTEIALNYNFQKAEKGNPPYAGDDPQIRTRWWQWPNWDKESAYLISRFKTGAKSNLKARLFYDRFYNVLKSFDDSTYQTQNRGYAFTSIYDDDSFGANAEWTTQALKSQQLGISAQFKQDTHRENNEGEPTRTFSDYTLSVGVDDRITISEKVSLIAGLGFNYRGSLQADDYNFNEDAITPFADNSSATWNGQIGINYSFNSASNIQFYTAKRTRFATLKDRYSYRLGVGLPNPDLDPENALHFNLTYTTTVGEKLSLEASAYLIKLTQTLQYVNLPDTQLTQIQNTGESTFAGFEFNARYRINEKFDLTAGYNYIDQKNNSNPDILFIDVPAHSLQAGILIKPFNGFQMRLVGRYNSDRNSTSYGTIAAAFDTYDLHLQYAYRDFTLMGGVQNLLDKNYAFNEGYPEPGRNFYVRLLYDLKTKS